MCGPCDMNTKKPNAGGGVLVRKGAGFTVTKGKIMMKDFQTAHDLGRAGKYHMDANWHSEAMCYILYGRVGGKRCDKEKTQEFIEASKDEMNYDSHGVHFMMGDFSMRHQTA